MREFSSVLIVDDHAMVCDSLAALIQQLLPGVRVFTAHSAAEARKQMAEHRISLALVDARMPMVSGIELMQEWRVQYPSLPLVGMTAFGHGETLLELLKLGLAGILLKQETTADELLRCLQALREGNHYHPRSVKTWVQQNTHRLNEGTVKLKPRYIEMIELLCLGYSTKEIAKHMGLKVATVETYRKDMLKELNCKNTVELVTCLFKNGML